MSVTSGNVATDAVLTSLAAMPTTFNNSLTGAVDINAAFTLSSGYLVRLQSEWFPVCFHCFLTRAIGSVLVTLR